jgi:hypothetical protein
MTRVLAAAITMIAAALTAACGRDGSPDPAATTVPTTVPVTEPGSTAPTSTTASPNAWEAGRFDTKLKAGVEVSPFEACFRASPFNLDSGLDMTALMCLPRPEREVYIRALLAESVKNRSIPQGASGCVVDWAVSDATPDALRAVAGVGGNLDDARRTVAEALSTCIEVASAHPEQLPAVPDGALDELADQARQSGEVDVSPHRDCLRENGFAKNGLYDAALMSCLPAAERGRYIGARPLVTADGITDECYFEWAELPETQTVFAESAVTSPTPTRARALFNGGITSCLGENFRPTPPTPTAIGGLLPTA